MGDLERGVAEVPNGFVLRVTSTVKPRSSLMSQACAASSLRPSAAGVASFLSWDALAWTWLGASGSGLALLPAKLVTHATSLVLIGPSAGQRYLRLAQALPSAMAIQAGHGTWMAKVPR